MKRATSSESCLAHTVSEAPVFFSPPLDLCQNDDSLQSSHFPKIMSFKYRPNDTTEQMHLDGSDYDLWASVNKSLFWSQCKQEAQLPLALNLGWKEGSENKIQAASGRTVNVRD